jgi:hypothetical protein
MPQFDKITFFNQIFWLFVFFSGYYLLLLKVFLPKLGAVLKARSKKLQKGTEGVVGFKQEQEEVSVVFNNSIEKMSSVVKKTISDSTATKVNCVFCNKSVYDHSNFESRECLSKHLQVQKILKN